MKSFVGCRIVRAPIAVPVNDLSDLIVAADERRPIVLTFTDGQSMFAWPFDVQQIDSLHRCSHLHLPGGCKFDVRPIVLLWLVTPGGIGVGMNCFARYNARTGRGTFISREVYERLQCKRRSGSLTWPSSRDVEPLVRTFNEQLLSEQPSHV